MYFWLQRWFEKIADARRSESNATKEVLQQQETSIRDAAQAWEQKQTEIGAAIAAAIKTAADTVPDYEKTQRKKEHGAQWAIFWVTLVGTIFAAAAAGGAWYYAMVAARQAGTMDRTYTEIQKQTADADATAEAGRSQARTAQQQIVMDQRPWLKFEVTPGKNNVTLAVNEPLVLPIDFQKVG